MEFPYGRAPLAILILSLASAVALLFSAHANQQTTSLIYTTFTKEHADTYHKELPQFESENKVKVQLEVVDAEALKSRLESALIVGAEVPDMIELQDGSMGYFTKGPLKDVGFVDLTDRVKQAGLWDTVVRSRFAKWSSRDHIFALPHDVHPTMLAYRRDLVEKFGIDVDSLKTWDDFTRVGRELVAKYRDASGVAQHYMINLESDGGDTVWMLTLQRGATLFDKEGNVAFDDPRTVDVVCWYAKQIQGKDQIAFDCGWGQNLAKAMDDGLALFVICPDWRTKQFELDMPHLSGKMALMPFPAWEPGGVRTTTWGGTGLAITKQCVQRGRFDLAWKLAMYLYFTPERLGPRFLNMNIIPPLMTAWNLPQFTAPREYWSGLRIGQLYAQLAPQVPNDNANPYLLKARDKLTEAFANTSLYYREHGDDGLRDFATHEIHRCAEQVRVVIKRNAFLFPPDSVAQAAGVAP